MGQIQPSGVGKDRGRVTAKLPYLYLFGTDEMPAPPRKAAKQSYDKRRLSPVTAGGVREGAINPALTVPPGKVRLDALTSPDWKRQLADFLWAYGHTRASDFTKTVSEETLRNRTDIMFSSVNALIKDKKLQHVRSLAQVKPRLLPRLFELWTEKGISKRAQINYYTNVRWFWRVCGLHIDPIASYEKEAGEFTITRTATSDKSWKGNKVDFAEIYAKLYAIDPVGARLALAMKQFGLRLKESLRLQPHAADGGDSLLLTHGTKTGRPRQLEFEVFDDVNFRKVLDALKDEVPPESHLAWRERTLKQAKRRMYYLADLVGLGHNTVTWKGLRQDWSIDQLEKLTGEIAPVRGGTVLKYREMISAKRKVTKAMGHNRTDITGAYVGSFMSLDAGQLRAFERSWNKIEPVMRAIGQILMASEVTNLYWIGARSLGASGESDNYEFALPPGTDDALAVQLAADIAELVLSSTGSDCIVHNWKTLPAAKQVLWEVEATPLFETVSPLDYMKRRLQEQKAARTAPKLAKTDATPAMRGPDEATAQ